MERITDIKAKIMKGQVKRSVADIPLMSPSASRLMAVISNTDKSIRDVIEIVKYDAPLTAKILQVVNSAAFGLSEKMTSIERAIPHLGDKIILGLALEDSASMVYHDDLIGYDGRKGDLWRHSLLTALLAREIAKFSTLAVSPEEAYTAGLLHDLGKGILSKFMEGAAPDLLGACPRIATLLQSRRNWPIFSLIFV